METQGRVLRVEGSKIFVEVKRQSACSGNCRDCSGCEARAMEVSAISDFPVASGDWVLLSSEQGSVLFGMFAVFILPLILPLAVYLLTMQTAWAWLLTAISLLAAVLLIWYLSKSKWFLARATPRIIEILPKEKC